MWIIDYAQSVRDELVSVVSESFPHLSGGAMLDFERIMKAHGYWDDSAWVRTPKATYTFPTGTKVEFITVDTYGKAHGPRRDVLFINEANNMPYIIADQLITRTRKIVWIDWNPSEEFWFYTDMLNRRDDVDFITLTYRDNEALDPTTIAEIESHKGNARWWKVYGLGELGANENRIYSGWQIIDSIPHEARLWRRGLDFGYTNDPSALVDVYEYNGGYIVDEKLYQRGMGNKAIADIIGAQEGQCLVVADSSEPKSVDEIASYGVNIIGAVKGPGSVNQGIRFVQDQRISVTSRSVNTIRAYRNYMWVVDRNGKTTNDPDDSVHEWSNSMDAVRYAFNNGHIGQGLAKFKSQARLNIHRDIW